MIGRAEVGLGFRVDRTGLVEVQKLLRNIQMSADLDMTPQMHDSIKAAGTLEKALNKAFDQNTGKIDLNSFNRYLRDSGTSAEELKRQLGQAGVQGQVALSKLNTELTLSGERLKQNNKWLNEMAVTLKNSLRWSAASAAIREFTQGVSDAFNYVKRLNSSLRDIQVVSGYSSDYMKEFAASANEAAKAIGLTTLDFTEAALIYIQQGKREDVVNQLSDITLRAAQVVGTSTKDMSEYLTAVWNGFQIGAEDAEAAVDKLAAVAANTGADLEELTTGMSKVASVAKVLGMDLDQLNAAIATVVTVTRQAPESVGTAFKTILARLEEVKLGETLEDGVDLGQVGQVLEKVGVQILDTKGELRDIGTVVEEIGNKWDTLSVAQQNAIAIVMAGKRQYNNLLALFDNWDMYMDAVNISANSLGTLQEQHEIYLQSITAYEHKLNAEMEALYSNIISEDAIKGTYAGITKLTEGLNSTIESLGGMQQMLPMIASMMITAFSPKLAINLDKQLKNLGIRYKDLTTRVQEYVAKRKNQEYTSPEQDALAQRRQQERQKIENQYAQGQINNEERIRQLATIEQAITREETVLQLRREERDLIKNATQEQRDRLTTYDREISSLEAKLRYERESKELTRQQMSDYENYVAQVRATNENRGNALANAAASMDSFYNENTRDIVRNEQQSRLMLEMTREQLSLGNMETNVLREQLNEWIRMDAISDELRIDLQRILSTSNSLVTVQDRLVRTAEQRATILEEQRQRMREQIIAAGVTEEADQRALMQRMESILLAQNNEHAEANILHLLQQQRQEREAQLNQVRRQQRIQQNIQRVNIAAMAFSSMAISFETIGNESANAEEKANSLLAGITNGAMAASFAMGPLAGSITMIGTILLKELLKASGALDVLEELFKTGGERIKEYAAEVNKLSDSLKSASENLDKVNEKLDRYNELKLKSQYGNLTAEERDELDTLTDQTENLKLQKEYEEARLAVLKEEARVKLEEGRNVKLDSASMQGRQSVADAIEGINTSFNLSIDEGTLEEQVRQLTEYRQQFNEEISNITREIGTKSLFTELSKDSQSVLTDWMKTLDDESKALIQKYFSGVELSDELQNQVKALIGGIDVSQYGKYAELGKNLDAQKDRLAPLLEEQKSAAQAFDETGEEYAQILGTYTDLMNSFNSTFYETGRLAKESLVNLKSDLSGLESQEIIPEGSQKELVLLSEAMRGLEEGRDSVEVLRELQAAGIDIEDNVANLEKNILSLAGSLSGELYQSLMKAVASGEISLGVFSSLTTQMEDLTNIAKSSAIATSPEAVADIYDQVLNAESDSVRQQAGKQLAGWDAVAKGTLDNQLAFIRESYAQQAQIQKVAQYQQLQNLQSSVKAQEDVVETAANNYKEALRKGDEELKASTLATYKETLQSLNDLNNQARELYTDFADKSYATAQEIQSAINSMFNEDGSLVSSDQAWMFLKDLPNYEEYFYEGTYSILEHLVDDQETSNQAIVEQIAVYQEGIDALKKEKAQLEENPVDMDFADTQARIKEIESEIENLEDLMDNAKLDLDINVDFSETADNIKKLIKASDDFYNTIHDGNTLTKNGYLLTNEQLEQAAEMYPKLILEHSKYVDGMMYLDQQGTDAFLSEIQARNQARVNEYNAAIDLKIKDIQAEIERLKGLRATNSATMADIARAHGLAAQAEMGFEGDKQQSYDTTGEKAGRVASDMSVNFDNAASSMSTSIANASKSMILNLQQVGMEARNVASQIANMDTPSYSPGGGATGSTYSKTGGIDVTNTAKSVKNTVNSNEVLSKGFGGALQGAIDFVGSQIPASIEQIDTQIEELEGAAARLMTYKGTVNNAAAGINRVNKDDGGKKGKKGKSGGDKETREALEAETDIYHQINAELDRQESILDALGTQKEQLYGKDYLGALEAEKSYLESINSLNKEKLGMQKDDLNSKRAALAAQGVAFDENGIITNFNEIITKKAAAVNAIKDEDTFEKAKEQYDKFIESIEEYEDLYGEFSDLEQDIIDKQVEIMENNLEAIVKKIEFDLQPTKDTINYLDFLNSFYENDFYQSGESVERLGEKFLETAESLDVYKNGIEDLQKKYKAGEISAADFNEEVRNQRDALQDELLTLSELEEEIEEAYGNALSEAEDKISKYTDTLEHYNGIMEHFVSLIDLIGEGHEFGMMADIFGAQSENFMAQLRVQQDWLDNLYIQKQLLEETGQEGTEAWFEVRTAIEETEDQIYSLAENALQALKDSYLNTIDEIIDELDRKVTQSSINSMLEQYARDKDLRDTYYDTPTQLYEIDTLQKDIEKSMDNITNKLQKKKLQGLNDELEVMRKLDHISEYDLERKKAEYEILMAQMALEDAQNNKQIMRLTRTSQGTREYTFTADAESVDNAAGEVTQAYNNLYQLSLEHMQNLEQQILDTTSAYEDELTQLYKDWADGKFASEDEFYQERDALVNYYEAKITDLTAQYAKVRQENAADAEDLMLNTSHETGEALIQQIEENKNQFNEAVAGMADRIGGDHGDSFRGMSQDTLAELDEAWGNYNNHIDEIKNEVDINLSDMSNKTEELRDESDYLATTISSDVVPALQNEIEEVIRATAAHREEAAALRDKIQAYIQWLGLLGKDVTQSYEKEGYNTDFAREALLNFANGDVSQAYESVAKRLDKMKIEQDSKEADAEYARFDKMFNAMKQNQELTQKVVDKLNKGYGVGEITSLFGFDTGGYTGDWGSTKGKLAILHEKEIVLNRGDTENMLAMLELTREVIAQAESIGAYKGDILNTNSIIKNISNVNDTSNQNIVVYADFPNATNQSEIEAALLSIQTDASQYSSRKR